jgi:hypothetical protein
MNTCHPRPKSRDHLVKLFTVTIALTLFAVPAMPQTNVLNTTGNVGIGTLTPGATLEVKASSEIMRLTGTSSSGAYAQFGDNGTVRGFVGYGPTLFSGVAISDMGFRSQGGIAFATGGGFLRAYIDASGNVGIGTSMPNAKVEIIGDSAIARLTGNNVDGAYAQYYDALNGATRGFIGYGPTLFSGNAISDMGFRSEGGMALATNGGYIRVYVNTSGNVGIGTTTPTKKLDVNGDINVSGNINAKYQDVAEWVPATEAMEPGTVVVLNPEKSNEVMPATRAYDTTVAGVVSTNPGLTLGERAASKAQIATVGRVRVKASATEQPIHIGDLLVTSGKTGVAMRSEPMQISGRAFHQPGTIIGKALEPLQKGEGEILVLLSLQ